MCPLYWKKITIYFCRIGNYLRPSPSNWRESRFLMSEVNEVREFSEKEREMILKIVVIEHNKSPKGQIDSIMSIRYNFVVISYYLLEYGIKLLLI